MEFGKILRIPSISLLNAASCQALAVFIYDIKCTSWSIFGVPRTRVFVPFDLCMTRYFWDILLPVSLWHAGNTLVIIFGIPNTRVIIRLNKLVRDQVFLGSILS